MDKVNEAGEDVGNCGEVTVPHKAAFTDICSLWRCCTISANLEPVTHRVKHHLLNFNHHPTHYYNTAAGSTGLPRQTLASTARCGSL